MRYETLANLYKELTKTTKRLEKRDLLTAFLKDLPSEEGELIYLLIGEIYPSYDDRKIGIAGQLLIKAITRATGASEETVVKEWKKRGDIGEVAEELIKQKTQTTLASHTLTTKKVLDTFRKLPELEGQGTINKKLALVTELLTSATPLEAKFITRTLLSDLRIGIHESTIRDALAIAFFDTNDEAKELIQRVIDQTNDLKITLDLVREKDLEKLRKVGPTIGKPMKVMLAQKVETIPEAFKELGTPCIAEYKYDGFRLLIHKDNAKVTLYTRRLENVTNQFPEIVSAIKANIRAKKAMIDAEAVGYDKETKAYTPFQKISQRIRRKYDIEKLTRELPVEVAVFDLLYLEKENYLERPLKERSEKLREIVKEESYRITLAKQIITSDEKEAHEFYDAALKENQEGIMLKSLTAPYKPGRRVGHMLKLKPSERDLDLVIVGAEWGTGRRKGWLSSFTLACQSEEGLKEVGKVSTGLKEKSEEGLSFEELTTMITPLIQKERGREVVVQPKVVIAITYQEIQKSPNYDSGLALRFPRVTALREDKPLEEIATLEEVRKDYAHQK